jgi:hypothetical protein
MSTDFLNARIARKRPAIKWMSIRESDQNPDCFDRSTIFAFTYIECGNDQEVVIAYCIFV